MQRETLKMLLFVLRDIQREQFLDPLPHGAARQIAKTCDDVEGVILDQEFGGAEILGECDFCEALLFVDDEGVSTCEDGGHFCASCTKSEIEAQASEKAAAEAGHA